MTEIEQQPKEPTAPSTAHRPWLVPTVWFVSGATGFFYEVFRGQNFQIAVLCAVWAAGGPALIADRLIRSLR